ncbi:alpha/beta fold hydrolase [bacterium]|nr:alpha/beta fold hydrolase [bacterium]
MLRRGFRIGSKSFNEIIAWASKDITREEFNAIKLPLGWFKNQPREVEMDGAKFLNSPGLEEGSFSRAEHFGHEWLHVATVKMAGRKRLDSKGLLVGSAVVKDHIAKFDEGRTLKLLISPSGEVFPRITRDANRTREEPTLPEKWRLIEHTLDRPMEFKLTGETTVIRADNQDSFQGPVKFSLDKSQPEQPTPSPDQASLLFQMFDRDGDKKISRDEAKGDQKDNFAFVDSNADGVIDLNEFIEARKLASAEPSYGRRNDKQWARMRSLSPDEDREFLMVNLIKYRAKAKYADGRKTDLTGEQANALYAPIKFIGQIGARIDYMGRVKDQMGNMNPRWDEVAIVRYPSRAKFFEMVTNPEFQKRAVHKDAGLEVSQVLLTESVPWQLSGAKRVADKNDAFTLAQLLKFRQTAEYADGTVVKREHTGKEAMDAFDVATECILRDVGARRMLKTSVEGALIGDGRTWDEFRMLHFPSETAYTAYCDAVEKMSDAVEHREAAIEDSYRMKAATMPLAKRLAISLATSVLGQRPTPSPEEAAGKNHVVEAQQVRAGVHRTPEACFADIKDFPFETHYIDIDGLRMAYVDEGTGKNGTFLLLHGEPVWSYMYRGAIAELAAAGYRVIAPDNIGFGRSDKVIDEDLYTLDNHVRTLKRLMTKLDLRNISIVVNDWGGPNGLIMATEMPDRFSRLIILNTWLHHDGYEYTQSLRDWNKRSQSMDFTKFFLFPPAVRAPFDGPDSVVGALRWPWMLPFAEPEAGNAIRQEAAWNNLAAWDKPAHVIFGDSDRVFTEEWGREFAAHIPGATFTSAKGEGHRPLLFTGPAGGQFTGENRGDEFAELILRLIRNERGEARPVTDR